MNSLVRNPVLPGFHPDPSFLRVGANFYLASSTFEWLPGVRIHHSRDLVHWRVAGHALTRPEQIDLKGVDSSAGSWAPSLSYARGLFWLIYTNVRTTGMGRPFKDAHVFLITATAIEGPWSDPIYLDAIGFDPSLFHDEDGRMWLLNMQWDFRKGRQRFAGIVAQEYDYTSRRLTGPVHELLRKDGVLCEGPNMYHHNGLYYLMLAEGGTGWNHGISMARSRNLLGPYELDPRETLLSTRQAPDHPLQKAGHGELVQTAAGEWWLAHLCSRPLRTGSTPNTGSPDTSVAASSHGGDRCMLGRETALQRVVWSEDGWLRLSVEGVLPELEVYAPAGLVPHPWPECREASGAYGTDHFTSPTLDKDWATLRVFPRQDWLCLSVRPGWLRLSARECPSSLHEQSLVARRLTSFVAVAQTRIEFDPRRYTQMAGLICWYDTRMFYYLRVTHDEKLGKVLSIMVMDNGIYDEPEGAFLPVADWAEIHLRADINGAFLQFYASRDSEVWESIGAPLDASKFSDDYPDGLHFTGAMVGIAAHDVAGQRSYADFDYFTLR